MFEYIAGLSLKSQDLTAIFLAVRLYCSLVMEYDIHTLLDSATLVATLWVIYMIRFKLRSTYMEDKDNLAIYYVVSRKPLFSLFFLPFSYAFHGLFFLLNGKESIVIWSNFLVFFVCVCYCTVLE